MESAILGRALIGAVGSEHYRAVFLAFAAANLPLLLCLKGVRDRAPVPTGTPGTEQDGGRVLGRSLGSVLVVFVTLYVLHVGIEAGVGWEPTHLETVGYTAAIAATATSVYWLMMTVGRRPPALRPRQSCSTTSPWWHLAKTVTLSTPASRKVRAKVAGSKSRPTSGMSGPVWKSRCTVRRGKRPGL